MLDLTTIITFAVASFALQITPGPAVMYVITRSIDQGRKAGVVSAAGVGTGTLFHVALAAMGLSAVLMTSATLFEIVKLAGAGYLIYLGIQKWREPATVLSDDPTNTLIWSKIYSQGVLVNVFNPKIALFFLAFLPQFVHPELGMPTLQIFTLGMVFVIVGIFSDSTYAMIAGTVGQGLKRSRIFWERQRYFAGSVFILLGLFTAITGSKQQ